MSFIAKLLNVIQQQIVKQVAETRGKNVRCIQLNRRLLPLSLTCDLVIGQFVICPLVTMCWRSVWITGDWIVDR